MAANFSPKGNSRRKAALNFSRDALRIACLELRGGQWQAELRKRDVGAEPPVKYYDPTYYQAATR